jgi:hypothetical protein
MQPINQTALQRYVQAFADHTCDTFFAEKDTISGQEIVSFTTIPQVNYLILFRLFNSWQQESGRLQSPYFDYSQEDVKAALTNLMNTLSQYIQVRRDAFEGLVAHAASDTLRLLLTPREQLILLLKDIDFQPLTIQRLQEHTRYLRVNRSVWEALLAQLQSNGVDEAEVVPLDKAIAVLDDVLASSTAVPEDTEAYLEQFSAYVPVERSELEKPEEPVKEQKPEPDKSKAPKSFFDSLPDEAPVAAKEPVLASKPVTPPSETVALQTESTATKPVTETVKPSTSPEMPPLAVSVIPEIKVEDVKVDIEQFAKAANKPLVTVLSVKKKSEEVTLNDTLNRDQTTLNDALRKEDSTFIEKAQNKPITSIKDALNLNQKYYFINSLFGGDNIAFAQAIYELEQATDLTSAMRLLEVKYAHSLSWDLQSEEYKEFVDVIERKFAS